MNPYGRFDDERREYVIVRPDTPLPWINYLGMEDFYGIVSNTAGGYCFYKDARLRRLTRYRYNDLPLDSNGRYLYVRDGDDVWCPMWKPVRASLERYECRHGLGYTSILGRRGGVEVEVRYFVPLGFSCEVWDVRVRNVSAGPKAPRLWGFVEWCLWNALDDMTNFQRNYSTGQVEVESQTVFHVTEYRERRNHFAYFHCSRPTSGFDTSRDAFVGLYGTLGDPIGVRSGCRGSVAHGWQPVGVHQVDLELAPGEEARFHFLLGYAENPETEKWESKGVANKAPFREVARRLSASADVDAAFEALRARWDDLLASFQCEVPNEHVRRMVNVWNQAQVMATLNLSRSASLYESGIGRGMGYRDSNQDLLGVVHLQPQRARQRILDLAATQLSDGSCYHQYQPLTKQGNSEIGMGFNDDPLWLPLSVYAYLAETGDFSILDERCPYSDAPDSPATLMDHLELSMDFTWRNRGPHGLPLIGHADWNDCLNLNCFSTTPGESFQTAGDIEGSVAESVMIAGLFCHASLKMAELYRHLGRQAEAEQALSRRGEMAAAIDAHGWDGEWFLRAYDARGRKVGSKECDEGRIFIESQGWCILGGVGLDDGRALRALDSVAEHLATPNGIVLQQPAYSEYRLELGEITSYPPGFKENAGIFTHNNTWIQIAETLVGRGDRAMEYYLSICPSRKEEQIDTYRCEPYVYSQMTAGPDAPTYGEAKNSWLTGTAAWSFVAISQAILGVQPTLEGLSVAPCIPSSWQAFSVQRRYRGATYRIRVSNPDGVCRGVRRISVDGREIQGNLLPISPHGSVVEVEVELG